MVQKTEVNRNVAFFYVINQLINDTAKNDKEKELLTTFTTQMMRCFDGIEPTWVGAMEAKWDEFLKDSNGLVSEPIGDHVPDHLPVNDLHTGDEARIPVFDGSAAAEPTHEMVVNNKEVGFAPDALADESNTLSDEENDLEKTEILEKVRNQ